MSKVKKKPLEDKWRRYALAGTVVAIIGSLIYFEQIPVLYVLSTLALIALLVTVAVSDLESIGVTKSKPEDETERPSQAEEMKRAA